MREDWIINKKRERKFTFYKIIKEIRNRYIEIIARRELMNFRKTLKFEIK